ncbi:SET5, partial [Symbiodinium pilosum]
AAAVSNRGRSKPRRTESPRTRRGHALILRAAVRYDAATCQLVAGGDVKAGEVVVEDCPILLVEDLPKEDPSDFLLAADPEDFLQRCRRMRSEKALASFRCLDAEKRKTVLSLHVPDLADPGFEDWRAEEEAAKGDEQAFLFLRVLRVNGVEVPDGRTALYATACRANHSCLPRARLSVEADGRVRLVALTPIRAGDEVTVSYLSESDLLEPSSIRRKLLRQTWGFLCSCQRCTQPDDRRSYLCPSCCSGMIGFQSRHVQLGAATAELDGWAACANCGKVMEAEEMANLEQLWVERHRKLPPWCRGSSGRAVLRNFLQPAAPQLSLSAVDELYQELGEPDEFASGAEVESLLAADEELARGLASTVLLYRDLTGLSGSMTPAMQAHWLAADAAGAALEAGLLLLKMSSMEGELQQAFQAQVDMLSLNPEELVGAADCRLGSLRQALGQETLTLEAAELLRLKALCLDFRDPMEATAVRRQALSIASALLADADLGGSLSLGVFLFRDGLELRIRDFEEGCYKLSLAERRLDRCLDDLESQLELEAVQQSGLVDEVLAARLVEQRRVIKLQQEELDQLHFEHQVLAEEAARLREEVEATVPEDMPEEEEFGVGFAEALDSPQAASERGRSPASPASAALSPDSRQGRRTSSRHSGSAR